MGLTYRRIQFLQQILNVYHRTHLPVHYETIGHCIGVSKWTAYDVLSELAKSGYLSRAYVSNKGDVGRSSVVFFPTSKAMALLTAMGGGEQHELSELRHKQQYNQQGVQSENKVPEANAPGESGNPPVYVDSLRNDELVAMKNSLLAHIRANEFSVNDEHTKDDVVRRLLKEITNARGNLTFCLYVLTLLIIYLKQIQNSTLHILENIVKVSEGPETKLLAFAGAALGTIIEKPSKKATARREILNLSNRFFRNVLSLKGVEIRTLCDFLLEALKGPVFDGAC